MKPELDALNNRERIQVVDHNDLRYGQVLMARWSEEDQQWWAVKPEAELDPQQSPLVAYRNVQVQAVV